MKRFKDLLLSLFIFGSIVVVFFIILSFFNTKRTIEINDTEINKNRLISLKEEANNLTEGSCKELINEYISYIDKSTFEGTTKLSEINNHLFYPILTYYNTSQEKCGFTEEELKESYVPEYLISQLSLSENLIDKYYFSYELTLKDKYRNDVEPDVNSMTYSSIRFNQLQVLEAFINLAKEREGINE